VRRAAWGQDVMQDDDDDDDDSSRTFIAQCTTELVQCLDMIGRVVGVVDWNGLVF